MRAALEAAETLGRGYKKAAVSRWAYHTPGSLTVCDHTVYTTLARTLRDAADKSRRENDFIYYHKLPADAIPLPEPRAMAKPTEFALPAVAEAWTTAKFSAKKIPKKGEVGGFWGKKPFFLFGWLLFDVHQADSIRLENSFSRLPTYFPLPA